MKKHLASLLAIACFAALPAFAQKEKIQADRPGRSVSAEMMTKGFLQAEIGFERRKEQKAYNSYDHPEADFRYGLSDRIELRAEIISETRKDFTTNDFRYGLKPLELGFKAKLIEEKGAMPAVTLFTHVGVPGTTSKDHKPKHASPEMRLLFQNKLSDVLNLDYNIGPEWDGEEASPFWFYSISPDVEIGEKFELLMEVFGRLQKGGSPEHSVDLGFGYYPTPDIKLDIFGGIGLSEAAPDYFISAGFSFRLKP